MKSWSSPVTSSTTSTLAATTCAPGMSPRAGRTNWLAARQDGVDDGRFSVRGRPARPSRRPPGNPRPCRVVAEAAGDVGVDVATARWPRRSCRDARPGRGRVACRPWALPRTASQPGCPSRIRSRPSSLQLVRESKACARPSSARRPRSRCARTGRARRSGCRRRRRGCPVSMPRSLIKTSERAISARARPRRRQARRVKTLCSQPRLTPSASFSIGWMALITPPATSSPS